MGNRFEPLEPMAPRVPLTLITGFLGSGKTTLCRHILAAGERKIALLINEFGEIAIDSKIIQGKNILMAELAGGCVCCSLIGEFEAAITEMLEKARPDTIVVETTGVAEPDALILDVQESLQAVSLDGVITVCDADSMQRFPQLGHIARLQIEAADLILLNKIDLVAGEDIMELRTKLSKLNGKAPILSTRCCRVDPDLLFGTGRESRPRQPVHKHQPEFESFSYATENFLNVECFSWLANHLPGSVYRAKGFVRDPQGTQLFNFVAGRWELEPFDTVNTALVFIGTDLDKDKAWIVANLRRCERE